MNRSNLFAGKIAWITGASSGIGEALVREFVRLGAKVIASSIDSEGLQRIIDSLGNEASMVTCIPFDLAETEKIGEIVSNQLGTNGEIDFLLNIGGISQRSRIDETPLWLERKIFEINYFGTIVLTKAVLPYMIKRKSGHILATSSISGRFGFPLRSTYSASKQALHGYFETLYLENKKNNIRASVIIPGRVRTEISMHALESTGREHGKLDEGQAKGITPRKAARIIIRGIKRNKREILVGRSELFLLYIRRIWPWLFFRIADKIKST
jgi:dehydrogenase/reductase SDR family protein 7B